MPEYVAAIIVSSALGWGGFVWRKSEKATELAHKCHARIDAVELKMAEDYLSKIEFREQMTQLFNTLNRFENKLDKLTDIQYDLATRHTINNDHRNLGQ